MRYTDFKVKELDKERFDIIIVGCGLAGLSAAYYASQEKKGKNKSIAIITKEFKTEASSFLAQGGIAAALSKNDSPEKHYKDTLKAGHYLNEKNTVRILVENIPKQIKELMDLGLEFDTTFGLEGMHSTARVLHIKGDKTGLELSNFILKLCKENDIKIVKAEVLELLSKNNEMQFLIARENKEEKLYYGDAFILAIGGYSGLWLNSTNPFALSNLISKAANIKTQLMDLEFEQFHPTTFSHTSKEKKFNLLISEAVRGEKAILVNEKNERITATLKQKELSGRDIISRLIFKQLMEGTKVYLDCNNKSPDFWKERFPTIYDKLREFGYEMGKDLIPVEPAAHYSIGGIKTNEKTMTNIKRLFAVGECSCNGLHGANRLASNSLSECLVFGKIAAQNAVKIRKQSITLKEFKEKKKTKKMKEIEEIELNEMQLQLKELLWVNVGIERNETKMKKALQEIKKMNEMLSNNIAENEEKKNKLLEELFLSEKIVVSALNRKHSIGVHYRSDFKNKPKELKHTIII